MSTRRWGRWAAAIIVTSTAAVAHPPTGAASPPAASVLWSRAFGDATGDDRASTVTATLLGDVFVGGSTAGNLDSQHAENSSSDGFVVRLDKNGRRKWLRQIDSSPDRADAVTAVSLNGDGDLYVVGSTEGDLDGEHPGTTSSDAFVARYTRSGRLVWLHQFGTASADSADAVVVSSLGDIYVAGETTDNLDGLHPMNSSSDGFIARFDRSGSLKWLKQFGTSTASAERASAITVTRAGTVFLAGTTSGDIDGLHDGNVSQDAFVARYDRSGMRSWVRQFGASGATAEQALGISVTGSGDVIAAGTTNGDLDSTHPGEHGEDGWVARFGADGVRSWIQQFGADGTDRFVGVVSSGTDVYAIGSTTGDLDGAHPSNSSTDRLLVRFDANGVRKWVLQSGSDADDEHSTGIATNARGEVFVSSTVRLTGPPAQTDAQVERITRASLPIWNTQSGVTGSDSVDGVTFAKDGDLVVIGAEGDDATLQRFGIGGTRKWSRLLGAVGTSDRLAAVTTNSSGEIFVVGTTASNLDGEHADIASTDVIVARYDDDGALVWLHQFGSPGADEGLAVAATAAGDVFVSGRTGGDLDGLHSGNSSWDGFVARFDRAGTLHWVNQVGTPDSDEVLSGIGASVAGISYAGGSTDGDADATHPTNSSPDALLVRFERDGRRRWVRQFGTGAGESDAIHAVQVNYRGEVFVAGDTAGNLDGNHPADGSLDLFIGRYSANGNRQWLHQLASDPARDDSAVSLTTTRTGEVWITGYTTGNLSGRNAGNTSSDALLVGYSRTGWRRAKLQFGTARDDWGRGVAVSRRGIAYVVGSTFGAMASAADAAGDGFVSRVLG